MWPLLQKNAIRRTTTATTTIWTVFDEPGQWETLRFGVIVSAWHISYRTCRQQ